MPTVALSWWCHQPGATPRQWKMQARRAGGWPGSFLARPGFAQRKRPLRGKRAKKCAMCFALGWHVPSHPSFMNMCLLRAPAIDSPSGSRHSFSWFTRRWPKIIPQRRTEFPHGSLTRAAWGYGRQPKAHPGPAQPSPVQSSGTVFRAARNPQSGQYIQSSGVCQMTIPREGVS